MRLEHLADKVGALEADVDALVERERERDRKINIAVGGAVLAGLLGLWPALAALLGKH